MFFAAKMAAWWMAVNAESVITYMTQGDERVRPWHLSLEGVSYRKSEFPAELIHLPILNDALTPAKPLAIR